MWQNAVFVARRLVTGLFEPQPSRARQSAEDTPAEATSHSVPMPSRARQSAEDTPAGVSIANQIARINTDMVINFAL